MIDVSEVKTELKKIRELASGKKSTDKAKVQTAFNELQSKVFHDISQTGDQRVRTLLRLLLEFKL